MVLLFSVFSVCEGHMITSLISGYFWKGSSAYLFTITCGGTESAYGVDVWLFLCYKHKLFISY